HAQRLRAAAAVTLLALVIGNAARGAFEEAVECAARRAVHLAAVVEAELAVGIARGGRRGGAEVDVDQRAFAFGIIDPDARAHRIAVAAARGIHGGRRERAGADGGFRRGARVRVAFLHVDQRDVRAV